MQRILGLPTCLLGLTAALLLFAACGQNEGGRCQVASDCGSGLTCVDGTSGNGQCKYPSTGTNDAASDQAEDTTGSLTSEAGAEAVMTSQIDAESVDAGVVDSDSLDSTGLD